MTGETGVRHFVSTAAKAELQSLRPRPHAAAAPSSSPSWRLRLCASTVAEVGLAPLGSCGLHHARSDRLGGILGLYSWTIPNGDLMAVCPGPRRGPALAIGVPADTISLVVDNECLTYVADRLDALGGRLEIEAASGAGTKLRARLPIPAVQSV